MDINEVIKFLEKQISGHRKLLSDMPNLSVVLKNAISHIEDTVQCITEDWSHLF